MLYWILGAGWLIAIILLCGFVHRMKQWLDTNPPVRKERRRHSGTVPMMRPDDIC